MSEFESSDVLPYTQVDRTAKAKAALLAGHLKVSAQHALGSLVEFWDLCAGDQRDLQRVLDATPEGQEPAIVLDAADVSLRFQLASGHPVEPVVLARLGLLEPVQQGFRVRGMSRYFRPILKKEINRENGAKGGKASKSRTTFAQAPAQATAQAVAQPLPQAIAQAVAKRSLDQEDSSQQSADSIQQTAPQQTGPSAQDKLREVWNAHRGPKLPEWRHSKHRDTPARERLKERDLEEWAAVVQRIARSAFCTGTNDRGWKADPEWLLRPGTATKVLEGKYDDAKGRVDLTGDWRSRVDHSQDFFAGVDT